MKYFWILMLCSISVFAQDDDSDGWTFYSKDDFSFEYPEDWDLDNSAQMGTSVIVLSPQEDDEDEFRENINVMIQDVSAYPDMTLEDYKELSEKQLANIFKNYSLITSKIETVNGKDRVHFLYTGDQQNYKLKFEQYGWMVNGSMYIITFTTEKSTYSIYKETGQRILNSFSVK